MQSKNIHNYKKQVKIQKGQIIMEATFIKELIITKNEIETIQKGLAKLDEFMNKTDELKLDLFEEWELDATSRWLNDIEDGDFFLDDNITIKEAE